jgi:hypothetical protein
MLRTVEITVQKATKQLAKEIRRQGQEIAGLHTTIAGLHTTIEGLQTTIYEQSATIAAQQRHISGAATATSLLVVGEIAGELRLQCFRKRYGSTHACPSTYRPTDSELDFFGIKKPAYLKLFHERVWAAHPSISDLLVLEHIAQYLLEVFPKMHDFLSLTPLLQSLQFARDLCGPVDDAGDRMKMTPDMVHFSDDHMPVAVKKALKAALDVAQRAAVDAAL